MTCRCSPPPVHALSLAVAQKCNLGCTYCYAQQGAFGGEAKNMSLETANRAVDLLLSQAGDGGKANLAFLGGEPLVNRPVIQAVTRRAAALAESRGIALSFSITTNGTLLTQADAAFFEAHGFAVTVSLDGPRELHDKLRPYKSGAGSFDRIMRNVQPLLAQQRRMQVSARVTVTPDNIDLRRTLDDFISAGFHSVGFSPMLSAPDRRGELQVDRSRAHARRHGRLRPRLRGAAGRGRSLPVRQHGQCDARDPPRHASALSVRRRCRIFRRVGGW